LPATTLQSFDFLLKNYPLDKYSYFAMTSGTVDVMNIKSGEVKEIEMPNPETTPSGMFILYAQKKYGIKKDEKSL